MITRTYLSKFNTIIKDSELNTGLNPIGELVYGKSVTRMLIYFDHSKVKELIENKTFADTNKLKHYLKITNAGSIDFKQLGLQEISSIGEDIKVRATSFDLIFFLIPQEWDNGKGYDYSLTFDNQGYYGGNCDTDVKVDSRRLLDYDGCNWYQARNGYDWEEEGIYTDSRLSTEYNHWAEGDENAIVIGRQHFDVGNESINLDITKIFSKFVTGELENYGIAIAYSPDYERFKDDKENYTGFLTNRTNTFFEPYVETVYDEYINDDRSNFALDKNNKLYLYCNIGDKLENLDELPTCNINGEEYEVKQATKGVYYVDINVSRTDYKPNTMLYDVWSNIKYNGVILDDVELDFTTKSNTIFFNIGDTISENIHLTPTIYGIKSSEKIRRGDTRKIIFLNKVNYSKNKQSLVDDMEWRLYIKDGTREVTVFDWEHVNKTFSENYTLIDTSILVPQKYYIDVKYKYNMEIIEHHNVLDFEITSLLENKYT